ncbi:unnamed protein product, partial [marine sediment metagenome]
VGIGTPTPTISITPPSTFEFIKMQASIGKRFLGLGGWKAKRTILWTGVQPFGGPFGGLPFPSVKEITSRFAGVTPETVWFPVSQSLSVFQSTIVGATARATVGVSHALSVATPPVYDVKVRPKIEGITIPQRGVISAIPSYKWLEMQEEFTGEIGGETGPTEGKIDEAMKQSQGPSLVGVKTQSPELEKAWTQTPSVITTPVYEVGVQPEIKAPSKIKDVEKQLALVATGPALRETPMVDAGLGALLGVSSAQKTSQLVRTGARLNLQQITGTGTVPSFPTP